VELKTTTVNTSPLGPATRMLQDIQRAAEYEDKTAKRSRRESMVGWKYIRWNCRRWMTVEGYNGMGSWIKGVKPQFYLNKEQNSLNDAIIIRNKLNLMIYDELINQFHRSTKKKE
jgi:hypothetical protein